MSTTKGTDCNSEHIKIFPCSCQDPGCSVFVIEDDYMDVTFAEFPVCITASSGWGLLDKFLAADRLYERGNVLFQNVAAVIDEEGEPVLQVYRNTKEGYIQKLIFGLLKAEEGGTPNPATIRMLHANGITAWHKDFFEPKSKRTFIRYRRIRGPFGIFRSLYEWLSLPLFAVSRIVFLLFGRYRITADCMADKKALEEYARSTRLTGLVNSLPDEDGEGGADLKEKCSVNVSLGMKIDAALKGLAVRKLQCYFYGTGECEYRLF